MTVFNFLFLWLLKFESLIRCFLKWFVNFVIELLHLWNITILLIKCFFSICLIIKMLTPVSNQINFLELCFFLSSLKQIFCLFWDNFSKSKSLWISIHLNLPCILIFLQFNNSCIQSKYSSGYFIFCRYNWMRLVPFQIWTIFSF